MESGNSPEHLTNIRTHGWLLGNNNIKEIVKYENKHLNIRGSRKREGTVFEFETDNYNTLLL